jgi:hypothetical protein
MADAVAPPTWERLEADGELTDGESQLIRQLVNEARERGLGLSVTLVSRAGPCARELTVSIAATP